jgi:hypothetical protein
MPSNLVWRSAAKGWVRGGAMRYHSTGVSSFRLSTSRLEQIGEDAFLPNLMLLLAFLAPLNYDEKSYYGA